MHMYHTNRKLWKCMQAIILTLARYKVQLGSSSLSFIDLLSMRNCTTYDKACGLQWKREQKSIYRRTCTTDNLSLASSIKELTLRLSAISSYHHITINLNLGTSGTSTMDSSSEYYIVYSELFVKLSWTVPLLSFLCASVAVPYCIARNFATKIRTMKISMKHLTCEVEPLIKIQIKD